jgi:hypothetical protein
MENQLSLFQMINPVFHLSRITPTGKYAPVERYQRNRLEDSLSQAAFDILTLVPGRNDELYFPPVLVAKRLIRESPWDAYVRYALIPITDSGFQINIRGFNNVRFFLRKPYCETYNSPALYTHTPDNIAIIETLAQVHTKRSAKAFTFDTFESFEAELKYFKPRRRSPAHVLPS